GINRVGRSTPRSQDAGFGYFVDAVVAALAAGERFNVWESDSINGVAPPTLASLAAAWMLELAEQGSTGVFPCCAREPTARTGRGRPGPAADVSGLAASPPQSGEPAPAAPPPAPVPYDTSLDARATARALGREPPSLDELLSTFRSERH